MGKTAKIALGAFCVLLVLCGGAWAFDSAHADTVQAGVTVSGVEIGGLDRSAATAKLEAALGPRLSRPLTVTAGGREFVLSPARAKVRYDYATAVDQAVTASRTAWIGARLWRQVSDSRLTRAIPIDVSVDRSVVRRFANHVADRADRKAIEPHLAYGPDWIKPVKGSNGFKVRADQLSSAVVASFQKPQSASRLTIAAPAVVTHPKTQLSRVGSLYPTVITVSRSGFRLYLWKDLKLAKTFPVAVGMAGLETPAGLYAVQEKETNPSWHVPNSAWAGALAGKTVPPGPDNPIKARWMGLAAGVGIHGTSALGSLGSAASHGCIRMNPDDVIWLYDRVPVGTPVYIS